MTAVNSFFVEKERALLAVLPDYDGSSEEAAAGFFAEIADQLVAVTSRLLQSYTREYTLLINFFYIPTRNLRH